jgi:hypothetical protein
MCSRAASLLRAPRAVLWNDIDLPERDTLNPSRLLVSGSSVFFHVRSGDRAGLMVWDAVRGSRPLVGWIGDGTRAAGDLGTDGHDLVWPSGEGITPEQRAHPSRRLMTALFTTDVTALHPRPGCASSRRASTP